MTSPGNPFILGSKGQGHESQKQHWRGCLHSCEGLLLLVISIISFWEAETPISEMTPGYYLSSGM